MTVLGNQLRKRVERDRRSVEDGERLLGETLSAGRRERSARLVSDALDVRELEKILAYFGLRAPKVPAEVHDSGELVDYVARTTGIVKRTVRLSEGWWKNGDGVMLARLRGTDSVVALFPGAFGGFFYTDGILEKKHRVTTEEASRFADEAICFFRPLPSHPLARKEFIRFLFAQIRASDMVLYVLVSVLSALLSAVVPLITNMALSQVVPTGARSQLLPMFLFVVVLEVCVYLLLRSASYSLIMRMQYRMDVALENSVYARVLGAPASFFSGKTAGGLSQRIAALNMLPTLLGDMLCIASSIITALVSALPVLYVVPQLLPAALVPTLLVLLAIVIVFMQERGLAMKKLASSEENGGIVFDLISGVQRIRLSGSEDRAYAKWVRHYADEAGVTFAVKFPAFAKTQIIRALQMLGLLWAFYLAYEHGVEAAGLAAFTSAYELALLNINLVANRSGRVAQFDPIWKIGKEILQLVPEQSANSVTVSSISGRVELSHVTFRYEADGPAVLDDLSLTIEPGEYVAIVGRSGCGKSTIVRLLLGFVFPTMGSVVYDNVDTRHADLRSLRRLMGAVLQDGKLFAGDIYSNIVMTAPECGLEDAWDAAQKAGIADDIRMMPMGMHTLVSEAHAGISGGQKQRLMIARAIIGKPRILILDEATSALDNLSQKVVTDSLNALTCTRIVIAHRLSTIQECDRIIAIDNGRIVEDGSYDELMRRGGFFADLVRRQQIDAA